MLHLITVLFSPSSSLSPPLSSSFLSRHVTSRFDWLIRYNSIQYNMRNCYDWFVDIMFYFNLWLISVCSSNIYSPLPCRLYQLLRLRQSSSRHLDSLSLSFPSVTCPVTCIVLIIPLYAKPIESKRRLRFFGSHTKSISFKRFLRSSVIFSLF